MSPKILFPPLKVLYTLFFNDRKFLAIFYTHIQHSNVRQTAKFRSIICKFDEVMPYYARSRREFSIGRGDLLVSMNGRLIHQILTT